MKIVVLNKTLHTREAATQLFKGFDKCSKVVLDFIHTEFMSRSFADQFYKEKCYLPQTAEIIAHNANEHVIMMLSIVSKTQNKIKRDYKDLPVYRFSDLKDLSKYLMSI